MFERLVGALEAQPWNESLERLRYSPDKVIDNLTSWFVAG